MANPFFDYLPVKKIEEALRAAPGNELKSKKIESPESSAALAANTFGLFLDNDQAREFPPIPGTESFGWSAKCVRIEYCARFPWRGGRQPLAGRLRCNGEPYNRH